MEEATVASLSIIGVAVIAVITFPFGRLSVCITKSGKWRERVCLLVPSGGNGVAMARESGVGTRVRQMEGGRRARAIAVVAKGKENSLLSEVK